MEPLGVSNLPVTTAPKLRQRRPIPGTVSTCDTVYRDLLGVAAWSRLRPEVRQRFSVRPAGNEQINYTGVMHMVELSVAGWLFAQLCRLFGTPLAPHRGKNVRMDIELAWDENLQGVSWHRTY